MIPEKKKFEQINNIKHFLIQLEASIFVGLLHTHTKMCMFFAMNEIVWLYSSGFICISEYKPNIENSIYVFVQGEKLGGHRISKREEKAKHKIVYEPSDSVNVKKNKSSF